MRIIKFLVVGVLLGCVLPLHAGESSASDACFQNFSTQFEKAKALLPDRFGSEWKMDTLPPEIAEELRALAGKSDELKDESERLHSRAVALEGDEDLLSHSENWLATRQEALNGKYKDLDEENQRLQEEMAKHNERFRHHEENPCYYTEETPHACDSYNAEKQNWMEKQSN